MVVVTYHEVVAAYFLEEVVEFGSLILGNIRERDAQALRPAFAQTSLPEESSWCFGAVGSGVSDLTGFGSGSGEHCIVKGIKADCNGVDVRLLRGDCKW